MTYRRTRTITKEQREGGRASVVSRASLSPCASLSSPIGTNGAPLIAPRRAFASKYAAWQSTKSYCVVRRRCSCQLGERERAESTSFTRRCREGRRGRAKGDADPRLALLRPTGRHRRPGICVRRKTINGRGVSGTLVSEKGTWRARHMAHYELM